MTDTRSHFFTPAMAAPSNWREAILAAEANGLTQFFSVMSDTIHKLESEIGNADMSVLFGNVLLLAKERMTSLVANGTQCKAQAQEAEQLVSDWIDQCVAPDLCNCIGITLWAMGTKPAIDVIRYHLS